VRGGAGSSSKPWFPYSQDRDLEKCMAQQPAHYANSNKLSDAMLRPSIGTPADQRFREIESALTALLISAMSALPMLSGVIGPTSL
jgi:hypothetical protein